MRQPVSAPLLAQMLEAAKARATTATSVSLGAPEKHLPGTPQAAGFDWEEQQAIQADLAYNVNKAARAHKAHDDNALRLQMQYPSVDGK